jgi:hypothetical protein
VECWWSRGFVGFVFESDRQVGKLRLETITNLVVIFDCNGQQVGKEVKAVDQRAKVFTVKLVRLYARVMDAPNGQEFDR